MAANKGDKDCFWISGHFAKQDAMELYELYSFRGWVQLGKNNWCFSVSPVYSKLFLYIDCSGNLRFFDIYGLHAMEEYLLDNLKRNIHQLAMLEKCPHSISLDVMKMISGFVGIDFTDMNLDEFKHFQLICFNIHHLYYEVLRSNDPNSHRTLWFPANGTYIRCETSQECVRCEQVITYHFQKKYFEDTGEFISCNFFCIPGRDRPKPWDGRLCCWLMCGWVEEIRKARALMCTPLRRSFEQEAVNEKAMSSDYKIFFFIGVTAALYKVCGDLFGLAQMAHVKQLDQFEDLHGMDTLFYGYAGWIVLKWFVGWYIVYDEYKKLKTAFDRNCFSKYCSAVFICLLFVLSPVALPIIGCVYYSLGTLPVPRINSINDLKPYTVLNWLIDTLPLALISLYFYALEGRINFHSDWKTFASIGGAAIAGCLSSMAVDIIDGAAVSPPTKVARVVNSLCGETLVFGLMFLETKNKHLSSFMIHMGILLFCNFFAYLYIIKGGTQKRHYPHLTLLLGPLWSTCLGRTLNCSGREMIASVFSGIAQILFVLAAAFGKGYFQNSVVLFSFLSILAVRGVLYLIFGWSYYRKLNPIVHNERVYTSHKRDVSMDVVGVGNDETIDIEADHTTVSEDLHLAQDLDFSRKRGYSSVSQKETYS